MSNAIQCEKCGGQLKVVEENFHMIKYECDSCDFEQYATISPMYENEFRNYQRMSLKAVYIIWKSVPSYKKITYAKQLFPELKKILNADLIKKYEKEKEWFMGYFEPDDVKGLGIKAKARGLEIKIVNSE
jgi:ribosomal protein L37E